MSATRIQCQKCGFPLAWCECGKPVSPSADAPREEVKMPLVGTGSIVGALFRRLPMQWYVLEGHWCKTPWRYVLTGKHRGQKLKLSTP
jgi:hypothetical protein